VVGVDAGGEQRVTLQLHGLGPVRFRGH